MPFCVLDEVDAALDEANVGRFARALRGLAEQTQFIVITHNRGTIEAADALYGVTIGDDAVSRVVSLRLPGTAGNGHADGSSRRASCARGGARLTGYEQGVAQDAPGRLLAPARRVRPADGRRGLGGGRGGAHRRRRRCGARRAGRRASARARRDIADPRDAVEAELLALFAPRDPTPWPRVPAPGVPAVVLVVGVNGTGKTTTVAKLGNRFATRGAKVILAAADTFRAAAIEQLEMWAQAHRTCRSSPTRPAPTHRPSSTTRWTRLRPATPMSWSSTRRAACTRRAT